MENRVMAEFLVKAVIIVLAFTVLRPKTAKAVEETAMSYAESDVTEVAEEMVMPYTESDVTEAVEEMVMPYTESDVTEIAQVVAVEAKGGNFTQKAAVAWCVLNRVDGWNITIYDVVNQPGAFAKGEPTDEDMVIARDVLDRWVFEKLGLVNCGRVLPVTYKYFSGNGKVNRFREEFRSKDHYDWSMISPYMV